jgi:hypothetical protein
MHVSDERTRPVREGHYPNGGHECTGEVGLSRSTREPVEQGRAAFRGGRGGKGTDDENIVQSHMRPTQSGKRMSQGLHGVRQAAFAATHPW